MGVKFIKEYIKNPRAIGAIAPSSKYLAKKMIQCIDFKNCECIVEYGPGTGVFTEKIIESKMKGTKLILIEVNDDMYKILRDKYSSNTNIYVINDSAENIENYLSVYEISKVDYIISGLPFASLPRETSHNILNKTKKILRDDGSFITFQYTLLKKDLINNYFNEIKIKREIKNIPPAYVLKCSK